MPLPVLFRSPPRGGGPAYPTVANSLLWINRFESKTDTLGSVPAVNGNAVWTIKLPSGWGASLGDGLVRQDTAGSRITYQANGLQNSSGTRVMNLPGSGISLAGNFTIYTIHRKDDFYRAGIILDNTSAGPGLYAGIGDNYVSGNSKALVGRNDGATILFDSAYYEKAIKKWSRSGSNVYFHEPGAAELTDTLSSTITLTRFLSSMASEYRFHQLVAVGGYLADGAAEDLAIRSKLLALEPDATDF